MFDTKDNLRQHIFEFEEISGCKFRHEIAPLCKYQKNCRINKCQFSHNNEDDNESEVCTENTDKEVETSADIKCDICNYTYMENEKVETNHKEDKYQECSECDFKSKCGTEYNKHWTSTPGHIFSREQLRDMGYKV